MRRNVVLNMYNRATYLNQTGNYVVKMCNQKFHLCMQFITRLNTVLAHVKLHASPERS